jgi:hypothetical protein
MTDHLKSSLVECTCGLRFMRTAIRTLAPESGHVRCACGNVIGAWNGPYRLAFEPEDDTTPPPQIDPPPH